MGNNGTLEILENKRKFALELEHRRKCYWIYLEENWVPLASKKILLYTVYATVGNILFAILFFPWISWSGLKVCALAIQVKRDYPSVRWSKLAAQIQLVQCCRCMSGCVCTRRREREKERKRERKTETDSRTNMGRERERGELDPHMQTFARPSVRPLVVHSVK